jgi:hypothetical protein
MNPPHYYETFRYRVRPRPKAFAVLGDRVRCHGVSDGSSSLMDIDLASGAEVRRAKYLPVMHQIQFQPPGWGLGYTRYPALGGGPSQLFFITPAGTLRRTKEIPDAASQICAGESCWYIGCRNGKLYKFSVDGKRIWTWEMPGCQDGHYSPYSRPCPYHVAAAGAFVVTGYGPEIFCLSSSGETLWNVPSPDRAKEANRFNSSGAVGASSACRILGLEPEASPEEIRRAYRRLAFRTHPDRNPQDATAADRFRRLRRAYEAALSGESNVAERPNISFQIGCMQPSTLLSFLEVRKESIWAGFNSGSLYRFDLHGALRERHRLGRGWVRACVREDGSLAAAYCSPVLTLFQGSQIAAKVTLPEYWVALGAQSDHVMAWWWNTAQVFNGCGQRLWTECFAKKIAGMACTENGFVILADQLYGWNRSSGENEPPPERPVVSGVTSGSPDLHLPQRKAR